MNRIIRFFQQFIFWVNISRYMGCKHCCINCKFYDFCKIDYQNELNEIDEYLDIKTKL